MVARTASKAPAKRPSRARTAAKRRTTQVDTPSIEATVNAAPFEPKMTRQDRIYSCLIAINGRDEVQIPLPNYQVIVRVTLSMRPRNIRELSLTQQDNYMTLNMTGEGLAMLCGGSDVDHFDVPLPGYELPNDGPGHGFIRLRVKDDYPSYVTVNIHSYAMVQLP